MPIIYHNKTDLFEFIKEAEMSMAHGCNTSSSFGSGVAYLVAKYFPHVKKHYHQSCKLDMFEPGSCDAVCISDTNSPFRFCYNLGTQIQPGPDARKNLIAQSFINLFETMIRTKESEIAIPKIGCGIGGLNWEKDVEPILDFLVRHVYDDRVTVHVCSLE